MAVINRPKSLIEYNHELVGVVEAVGADVRKVKKGDLVVAPIAFSDGTCVFCRAGLHTSCVLGGFFGMNDVGHRQKPCASHRQTEP